MTLWSKTWRLILALVLLFVIFKTGFKIYQLIQQKKSIDNEVAALQAEAEKYSRENDELTKLVKYFDSEEFQEKEIKDKLNLIKEGEKVVMIKKSATHKTVEEEEENVKPEVVVKMANYYYWWKFFFGTDSES